MCNSFSVVNYLKFFSTAAFLDDFIIIFNAPVYILKMIIYRFQTIY